MRWGTWLVLAGLALSAPSAASGAQEGGLPFVDDLDRALEQARESDRPVAIVFVAAWCPNCERLKRTTLGDPLVLRHAEDVVWVMIDIDRHLTIAREYDVEAVPLIWLLDPQGRRRSAILGLVGPVEIEAEVARLLGGTAPEGPALAAARGPNPQSRLVWGPRGYRGQGICFSHVGYGPLELPSQSPFQALRLGIFPRTPSTLSKGQLEFHASGTWVNIWAPDNDFFLDYEMTDAVLRMSYGVTDRIQLDGQFENRTRFGGVLDGLTQGFHDLFGIDQNGRDEVDKGRFVFEVAPEGQPSVALDNGDRGSFTRSLGVTLRHTLTCGTAHLPAFSYSVTTRSEMLDVDAGGGGNLDVAVSVALARRLGRFYIYGTLGHAWFGKDEFRGIRLRHTQSTGLVAFEWRFKPRQSMLLQYLVSEGLIDGFEDFASPSNEITLGYKWEFFENHLFEAGLVENTAPFDNSPDFGVHLGYSRRF